MALFNIASNPSSRLSMVHDGVMWSMVKASREASSEPMKKISARFIANLFCDQSLLPVVMENKGVSVSGSVMKLAGFALCEVQVRIMCSSCC